MGTMPEEELEAEPELELKAEHEHDGTTSLTDLTNLTVLVD